jgi:membrane protein required for colicin V production
VSWLDIVIVVGLALSVLSGLKNGLIKSVLTLVGVIVGVVLAGWFYAPLAERLVFISNPAVAQVVAFAIILVVVMIAAAIAAAVLKWTAEAVLLGWLNRLGGAVFGMVLGAIFWGAALAVWLKFIGPAQVILDSGIATFLLGIFPFILNLLPEEFNQVRSFFG